MSKYFFIGAGGVLGAIFRYIIKGIHLNDYNGNIPLNTLFVNISGSFMLAFLLTAAIVVYELDENIKLGLGTGFLGAYTTFSTICKETVLLLKQGLYFSAVSYVIVTALLGLAAVYLGILTAREAASRYIKLKNSMVFESNTGDETDGEVD